MTSDRLKYLISLYHSGPLTEEQWGELISALRAKEFPDEWDLDVRQIFNQPASNEIIDGEIDKKMKAAIWLEVSKNPIMIPPAGRLSFLKTTWLRSAALILFIAGTAAFVYFITKPQKELTQETSVKVKGPGLLPGKQGAVLTLADGTQIVLDSLKNGVLPTRQEGSLITLKKGLLAYSAQNNEMPAGREAITRYNKLSTPRGRQFQLELPDGTKVWLNAASSIKYPVVFNDTSRIVNITGEAFFEVAHKTRSGISGSPHQMVPFIVKTRGQKVEVLGTHFNINAYDDEEAEKTTLLEGSVNVSSNTIPGSQYRDETMKLLPGQQATLSPSGIFRVENVDTEPVIDWKTDKFIFKGDNIEGIMRKIARLYDVDVVFEGNMANKDFVGSVSRFKDVTEILRKLELTGIIKFKIEGKKIIVMP